MRAIEAIRRSGIGIGPDETITQAAKAMSAAGVGALAVLDASDRPVGMLTDRDLVRRAMAKGMEGDARVDAVMSTPPVVIDANADLHAAFAVFRDNAVRRIMVLDGERFVGMLTIDDLLIDLAADLADLARPVTAEVLFGHHDAEVPAAT